MNAGLLIIIFGIAVAVVVVVVQKSPPPPSTAPVRVSGLCKAAFFFALLALLTALGAGLTAESLQFRDLLGLRHMDVRALRRVAEGLRLAALLPALAALAFAVAGRGAVRESGGALRGKALYRTSALVALGVGAAAWAAFTAAPPGSP